MTKTALHTQFSGIHSLRSSILKKEISATEVAISAIAKAKELESLNIFLHIDEELTLKRAKEVDILFSKTSQLPALAGIPIAHKDNIVTKNWYTTAGSKILEKYLSPFDATVVDELNKAGSVSIGKLNCDEFGMGSSNENSAYGPVRNPWDPQIVPGGSSGGSAAAVAARIVMASTGTDTGGSIRTPSSFCGVCGIKPTYGTVSRYGVIAFASSLDQVGVIATNSMDLLEMLDIISTHDNKDSTNLKEFNGIKNQTGRLKKDFEEHKKKFDHNIDRPLKDIKIGIPREFFETNIHEDILFAIKKAISDFESLGASIIDISIPSSKISIPVYYTLASAEASSNLARYDGVRYGYRTSNFNNIEEMISRSRSEGFGHEVKHRILLGTYLLSKDNYNKYYMTAQKVRRVITNDFQEKLTKECDIILAPVYPKPIKKIGAKNDSDWIDDIFTVNANLAGLPAMSIPCGFNKNNNLQPIGIQIIGNYFTEGLMIAVSDYYQQITNWHKQTPENI
ncbi:aspartyl-tRNA(Asn)/glutamyl-tRNA (Gln) amidotransferase subunit A [Candidatus Kinetoplastibacterium desouzaii TCC079E]|uniref:Glutamyl-tRNA(Gln) amidotransferase subunit A n=1 Tax=Candidatus Kinetoplastidibacterium desouzai TCC079E TaxID=1208919 RepID=M1LNE3_9PROT|nr:Asp-tRNA(Asn)/Glu-tRNA(Gln) amidotransferase subunit GatA [Candidatus Kinetoplastibacterium desouzaii]AGF47217.1 aspartyl-tRNA(Asn)/glutamyl-tRNA (Gln) amidotransferase subunit A [Candidatus Kinetoplastibacterium desouzaii TCC079E]